MKKIRLGAAALVLAVLGCFFTGCQGKNVLTIYTWADMFPPEVLYSFERETGYRINYVNFEENEAMLTKLETAKGGSYDLIIADDYIIETVIEKGLAQKLNKSELSNHGNINPVYQNQFYDPTNEYTIPYGAGVMTIVYDPSRVDIEITGYADLWDQRLRNNLGIIANYRVINGMALKILDHSYNTNDAGIIRSAGSLLLGLAPNIRLIRDDKLEDELLSGEIAAAVLYTASATHAMMENPDLEIVFPKEGIGFGIMAGFIPSNAPNAHAAHLFLNYIMEAERGAQCFEHLGYYSTFVASDKFIAHEYREFLTLPEGFDIESEMIQNISEEAEEEHLRVFNIFKNETGLF